MGRTWRLETCQVAENLAGRLQGATCKRDRVQLTHIDVRRMQPGDEARVRAASSLFDHPLDDEAVRAFLAAPDHHLLIAYVGGEAAGCAIAHELRRLDGSRPKLLLYSIETHPAFRRQGVGRALIAALERLGRARKARSMFLLTNASNVPAMQFYLATGAERRSEDDVLFEYRLDE